MSKASVAVLGFVVLGACTRPPVFADGGVDAAMAEPDSGLRFWDAREIPLSVHRRAQSTLLATSSGLILYYTEYDVDRLTARIHRVPWNADAGPGADGVIYEKQFRYLHHANPNDVSGWRQASGRNGGPLAIWDFGDMKADGYEWIVFNESQPKVLEAGCRIRRETGFPAIGSASLDGEAWAILDQSGLEECIQTKPGLVCYDRVTLFSLRQDGGFGYACGNDLQPEPNAHARWPMLHPTARVGASANLAFFSFNDEGEVTQSAWCDGGCLRELPEDGLFWPTPDLPYRRLATITRGVPQADGGPRLCRTELREWRWVADGGIEWSVSPLGRFFSSIGGVKETSEGVLIHGIPNCDVSKISYGSGGGCFCKGSRVALVSKDGRRVLKSVDRPWMSMPVSDGGSATLQGLVEAGSHFWGVFVLGQPHLRPWDEGFVPARYFIADTNFNSEFDVTETDAGF